MKRNNNLTYKESDSVKIFYIVLYVSSFLSIMYSDPNFLQTSKQNYENLHVNMYHSINQPTYGRSYDANVQHNFIYPSESLYNINNDIIPISIEKRQCIERDIENFLQEFNQSNDSSNLRNTFRKSKISMAKNIMTSAYKLNEKLQAICKDLKNNQDLTDGEWQEKIDVCNAAKYEIIKLLDTIKDPNFLKQLMKDLDRRKKQRLREKLKKEKWRHEKLLRTERRARLHAEIDSWIRKEQAVIEKEKQEENLRKDADMILSDVRGKRSDVRKYLGLLQELRNLHNVKANIARARGEHLSSAADEAFNNIIALSGCYVTGAKCVKEPDVPIQGTFIAVKLTEQWSNLDRVYSIEEQGLKLMLKTDNEKRIEKQKRSSFDEWENVLFGKKILMCDQLRPDLNTFVAMRTAWDKYISSDNDASAIPIGWIVPDKPSSATWQKCLKKVL